MKVLLLGEYSGLHNNLAEGLKQNNIKVITAHAGDGFKSFHSNFSLKPRFKNLILFNIERILRELQFLLFLEKFDIIQIINPSVFSRFHIFNPYTLLRKKTKKLVLLAVGDDYYYWKAYREGKYKRSPHEGHLIDCGLKISEWENTRLRKYNIYLAANSEIIACADIYFLAYVWKKNNLHFIPYPFHFIEKPNFYNSHKSDKIKVLVGIQKSRIYFKGTEIFLDAISLGNESNLLSSYEFIYIENKSFNDYIEEMKKCDIVFDQLNSYEPGMNALLAMSLGKIVIGGNESKLFSKSEYSISPLINVEKNSKNIIDLLIHLSNNKSLLEKISIEGYNYVQTIHNSKKIANDFLKIWNS